MTAKRIYTIPQTDIFRYLSPSVMLNVSTGTDNNDGGDEWTPGGTGTGAGSGAQ